MSTVIDDGLTDEERAALQEDDGSGTEANAEGTPNAEQEAAAAAADDKPEVEKPAAEAGAEDTPAAADGAAADAEPEAAEAVAQSLPVLVAPPPENSEARLTEIATKKEALIDQFDNGDITAKEYQKALDTLSREERQIEMQVHEFTLSQKMEQQRLQNDWVATCNAFVEANTVYKDNPRLYRALDAEVRDLAAKPETANWSGQKFLDEAHKNIAQAFNLSPTAKPAAATPSARRELPPNLARVPAADVEDTNGGQFAVLDRLATTDPIGYEEALAKMPEGQREAYLRA